MTMLSYGTEDQTVSAEVSHLSHTGNQTLEPESRASTQSCEDARLHTMRAGAPLPNQQFIPKVLRTAYFLNKFGSEIHLAGKADWMRRRPVRTCTCTYLSQDEHSCLVADVNVDFLHCPRLTKGVTCIQFRHLLASLKSSRSEL